MRLSQASHSRSLQWSKKTLYAAPPGSASLTGSDGGANPYILSDARGCSAGNLGVLDPSFAKFQTLSRARTSHAQARTDLVPFRDAELP